MKPYIVFEGGKILSEHDKWPRIAPTGTYTLALVGWKIPMWYRNIAIGHTTPINKCDIPKEIKMLCLVLNIPL
jgi:hypothetical protein